MFKQLGMEIIKAVENKLTPKLEEIENKLNIQANDVSQIKSYIDSWQNPPNSSFMGSIKFHQTGGTVTYYVHIQRGKVTSGSVGFGHHHTHSIVGGWYDGKRLVLMCQGNYFDVDNAWFSSVQHFQKKENMFILEQILYGYKQTIEGGGVDTPHDIDEINC